MECRPLLELVRADLGVHALSHVTGGGLAANLARVLPDHLHARVDRSTWTPPAIFQLVQSVGGLKQADVDATLNMGVGMVAILPQDEVDAALAVLAARGVHSWVIGEIQASEGPGEAFLL